MKFSIKLVGALAMMAAVFSACEKKIEPLQASFPVTVDYKSSGAKYLTTDVEVNPKDSIYFDFTIQSGTDMAVVEIQRNGAKTDTFKLTAANKNLFSGSIKYRADSVPGDYTYRVLARDARSIFLGDGGKTIKVTVKPDFNFYTYRFLYTPDSLAKTSNTYFASATGNLYSYTTGAANSAAIDFGFFYDTTAANNYSLYALSAAPAQLSFYDLNNWTKNATIMKKATTPSFANITSAGTLRAGGITNLASGTTSKITALAAGNLVFFKTVAGKYGCLQVNYIDGASASKNTYINVDVKIEK